MTQIRRRIFLTTFLIGLIAMLAYGVALAQSPAAPSRHRTIHTIQLTSKKITLPFGNKTFAGKGEDATIANEHCLLCHSRGMIDTQPQLTLESWKKEVDKMRTAYGCPLRADQTDGVAKFIAHAASASAAGGD
jgi:hypothetical protein